MAVVVVAASQDDKPEPEPEQQAQQDGAGSLIMNHHQHVPPQDDAQVTAAEPSKALEEENKQVEAADADSLQVAAATAEVVNTDEAEDGKKKQSTSE